MKLETALARAAQSFEQMRGTVRGLRGCRLCRSITYSVFLLILAVEIIVLVPSAYNFRDNALRRLELQAVTLVQSARLTQAAPLEAALQPLLDRLVDDPRLKGVRIVAPDGTTLARSGDAEFPAFAPAEIAESSENRPRRLAHQDNRLDLAWNAALGDAPVIALARVDSSPVRAELSTYVLRIAGLVALIVGVVTTGTMLVLYRTVLGPILRLRRSMLLAAAEPDRADIFQVTEPARDELGEVFRTHNLMLSRIADSKRSDRAHADEQAQFLSRHDLLTHLPNRAFFIEHLRESLPAARKERDMVVVFVLNLAGFRGINEGFGQQAGNEVLRTVARRLTERATGDFVARLGADEFGLVRIGQVTPVHAAAAAERVLARIAEPLSIGGEAIRLQGRVGIAYSYGDRDAETLTRDAELALSMIRTGSPGQYRFFEPKMAEAARRRQEIERELERALAQRQFELFYQPKVRLDATDGAMRIAACEALLRWRHPERGLVPPMEFIPVAEATGLIGRIGTWAIHEGCRQIRRWIDAGLDAPRVAVNLSAHQFRDPGLENTVKAALLASQVEPGLLELEITETVVMDDVEKTATTLSALRALGVHLSIDDFGTGYSSLSYLRRFEVDSIKIDKSFVDDIGKDANADAICDAIIRLAHSLGKQVVAEGVETELQCEFLRMRCCEEAQGYFFSRPVPAAEIQPRLTPRPA